MHSNIGPGPIILFGSGEMSPTGRRIQEEVIKNYNLPVPLPLGILETPTGFEVNAIHAWPERMQEFYKKGLQNYKPEIYRIRAWSNGGKYSTDDSTIVGKIRDLSYLYCGAGSPTYTANNLKNTKAYDEMVALHNRGGVLCLGSASVIALGDFVLPVYEIFKAGHALHWEAGLQFFTRYGLHIVLVPHWNNQEGEDFDTAFCWMGKERFETLHSLLPNNIVVLGIDEQTAIVIDPKTETVSVKGTGGVHILRDGISINKESNTVFSLATLQ